MEDFIKLFLFAVLAFLCFGIYFIFKILEFVVKAINLYEKMLTRLDIIIKLVQKEDQKTVIKTSNKNKSPAINKIIEEKKTTIPEEPKIVRSKDFFDLET